MILLCLVNGPPDGGVVVIKVSEMLCKHVLVSGGEFFRIRKRGDGDLSVCVMLLCVFGDACEPGQVRSGHSFGSGLFATVMEIGRDEHLWMAQSTVARG